ncbi:hypothetical protein TNCV_2377881 [Trichonephila clavipes]|nr:hypothetical protein TNCV_2377881 [Trichonephila clavipes]
MPKESICLQEIGSFAERGGSSRHALAHKHKLHKSLDLVILTHGQVKSMTPELVRHSPNFHTAPTGVVFASTDLTRITSLHSSSVASKFHTVHLEGFWRRTS